MEPFLSSSCFNAFQKAMKSPIGQAYFSSFTKLDPTPPDSVNLLKSVERLKKGEFASPKEWISDVSSRVKAAVRYFGSDSEFSIVLSTLYQMIEDDTKFLNQKVGKYSTILKSFHLKLKEFAEKSPDDVESFKSFVETKDSVDVPSETTAPSAQSDNIDRLELRGMIQRLPTDEDVRHVGELIGKYEPLGTPTKGTVEYNIKEWSAFTVKTVYDYVKDRAIPVAPHVRTTTTPINPALIPRMRSTPLPPSILNGTLKPLQLKTADGESKVLMLSPAAKAANQLMMKMISSQAQLAATSPFLAISPTANKSHITFVKENEEKQPETAKS